MSLAKEKAEELYKKFEFIYTQDYIHKHEIIECAKICVEQIKIAIDLDNILPENKDDFWDNVIWELSNL